MSLFNEDDIVQNQSQLSKNTLIALGASEPEGSIEDFIKQQKTEDIGKNPYLDDLAKQAGSSNLDLRVESGMTEDTGFRHKKAKEAVHDYAKATLSAEQGFIDTANRSMLSIQDPLELTPDEAVSLAKEKGVDLKFDKNTPRGEVMYTINRQIYKKELEQQVATYASDPNFSTLQKIGLIGSAISGSVGAAEVAASIGLSFLLPEAGLALVAKGARVGMFGKSAMDGIALAYKTKKATQIAQRYKNSAAVLTTTGNTLEDAATTALFLKKGQGVARAQALAAKNAEVAKAAGGATNYWYNVSSGIHRGGFSMFDTFTKESLPVASSLFASDFVASQAPFMAMSGYNSSKNQFNTYTLKEAAIDSLFAATLGVTVPVVAKTIKGAWNMGADILGGMVDNFKSTRAKATADEFTQGVDYTKLKTETNKVITDLTNTASELREPPPSILNQSEFLRKQNISDDEFMLMLNHTVKSILEKNEIPRMSDLPLKGLWLSHLDSSIIKALETDPSEFLKAVKISPYKNMYGARAVVSGDTGLLGREILGIDPSMAQSLLQDAYKANLQDDAEAYVRFVDTNNRLLNTADELEALIQKEREVKYTEFQGKIIPLTDEVDTKAELDNLFRELFYGKERADSMKQANKESFVDSVLKGGPQAYDHSEFDVLISDLTREHRIKSGSRIGTDGEKIRALASDLREMADNNRRILDTDEFLRQTYDTPEKLLDNLVNGQAALDTDASRLFGISRVSSDEYKAILSDVDSQKDLVAAARIKTQQLLEKEDSSANKFINTQTVQKGQISKATNSPMDPYFLKLKAKVDNIDKVLIQDLPSMRSSLVENIQKDADFNTWVAQYKASGRYKKPGRKSQLLSQSSPLRKIITTTLVEPLEKQGILFKQGREIDAAINRFITILDNPLDPINVKSTGVVTKDVTDESTKEIAESLMEAKAVEDTLGPLFSSLERDLLNEQFNAINIQNNLIRDFDRMVSNPFYASEVLMSDFTFSPYNITGSAINIENMTRNSTRYIRDIKMRLQQNHNLDLVNFMDNKSNLNDINKAILIIDEYGSADSAKKAGIALNDSAAIIAKEILDQRATMLDSLRRAGALTTLSGTPLNINRLAKASLFIPDSEIEDVASMLGEMKYLQQRYDNIIKNPSNKDYLTGTVKYADRTISEFEANEKTAAYIQQINESLSNLSGKSPEDRLLSHFMFKHADLDSMFNTKGAYLYGLNRIRDHILKGTIADAIGEDLYEFRRGVSALKHIVRSLVGENGDPKKGRLPYNGWILNLQQGSQNIASVYKGTSSKYIQDLYPTISFKNSDSALVGQKLFGFDTLHEQLDHEFHTIKRAEGVLKTTGAEPIEFVSHLVDSWNTHVKLEARGEYLNKDLSKLYIEHDKYLRIINNAKMVCGIDTVPAGVGVRVANVVKDLLSSSLLVKAGFKSLTDWAYQHQYLITNGLADSKSLPVFGKVIANVAQYLSDPELRQALLLSNTITQDGLLRLLLNDETTSLGKFAQKPGTLEAMEQFGKSYANFMINSVGRVEHVTNINKNAGAIFYMRSVAEQASKMFGQLDPSLQASLSRYSIDAKDWDFIRINSVMDINEYITKRVGPTEKQRNFVMMFPDLIADTSDEVIQKEMTSRGYKFITENNIKEFRDNLTEKASIMINTAANEMVTLPTARTLTSLTAGWDKNTKFGAAMGIITQYQSFGLACTQIHFGRKLANFTDTTASPLHILDVLAGKAGVQGPASVLGLILSTAVWQFCIDEAIDLSTGNRQEFTKKDGSINAQKITDPLLASTGFFGAYLDGFFNLFEKGGTRGGGVAIPAMPAISALYKDTSNVLRAAMSESTEDNRIGAITAASAQNLSRMVGLSTAPFVSLFWNMAFGSWLEKQAMGEEAYNKKIRRRKKEGFIVSEDKAEAEPLWDKFN